MALFSARPNFGRLSGEAWAETRDFGEAFWLSGITSAGDKSFNVDVAPAGASGSFAGEALMLKGRQQ